MKLQLTESINVSLADGTIVLQEGRPPSKIKIEVEAIHPTITKNFTYYSLDELDKGLKSWLEPYPKPVLKNHDMMTEPLGRVRKAEIKDSVLTSGKALVLTLEITDPDTVKKVRDGRYLTLSIGAYAGSVRCSICGTELTQGMCEHQRGKRYEDKLCYWEVRDLEFSEISFVNNPADQNAQVIKVKESEDISVRSSESIQESVSDMEDIQKLMEELDDIEPINVDEETKDEIAILEELAKDESIIQQRIENLEEDVDELIVKVESLIEAMDKLTKQIEALESNLEDIISDTSESVNKIGIKVNELDKAIEENNQKHKILTEQVFKMFSLMKSMLVTELAKLKNISLKEAKELYRNAKITDLKEEYDSILDVQEKFQLNINEHVNAQVEDNTQTSKKRVTPEEVVDLILKKMMKN